jgi:hypothetical protein
LEFTSTSDIVELAGVNGLVEGPQVRISGIVKDKKAAIKSILFAMGYNLQIRGKQDVVRTTPKCNYENNIREQTRLDALEKLYIIR